ncbi:MAG: metallophosphoesterase [Solirubrobacteraceae bacterium]
MHRPDRTVIQLSDPHLRAEPGPADDRLALALATVGDGGAEPAALLLTGDLSHDGSVASYRRLAATIERFAGTGALVGADGDGFGGPLVHADGEGAGDARAVGGGGATSGGRPATGGGRPLPMVVVPGNHDDVETLRRTLRDGEPIDRSVRVGGLRIVALDSTAAGAHHGELSDAQLEWLRAELAVAAPEGTILALHHPPLRNPHPVSARIALRDPERLAAVVAGTDVRQIVCGHAHATAAGTLAGIPVWSAPALGSTTDALPPAGRLRAYDDIGGLTRIDLFGPDTVTTRVPLTARPAWRYDDPEAERIAGLERQAARG